MAIGQKFQFGFQSPINTGYNAGFPLPMNSNPPKETKSNTYNARYPGFDEDDYKKLERLANEKGVTGKAKTQLMDELYQYYAPQVTNSHKLDQRNEEINQMTYQNNGKEPGNTSLKLTGISQKAKQKYNIDASVNDDELLESIVKGTPNGEKLLQDYVNNGNPEFLYVAGIEDRPVQEVKDKTFLEEVGQVGTDIVGGAYDSATSLFRMGGKGIANAIGWTAKQLGADEDKVDSLVQSYKDYVDNDFSAKAIGSDTDSASYGVTKAVGDLAQVVGGEALLKGAIQGTAKGAEILNYLKDAPTWQKIIAGGLEGAGDMTLYSIVADNELPSEGELGIGAAIGAAIPGVSAAYKAAKPVVKKGLEKVAAKLELSGLLNPAKLNAVKNQLITEGTDLAKAGLKGGEADDVGKWMIERGFKGDKPTIIKDLGNYAKKSHSLKKEVLGASKSLHTVESANKSLDVIHNTIKDVPGLEKKLARVEELMAKQKHTLSELDEIKSILDDTVSIYTNAGDVRGGAVKKGLDLVRKDLKKYIEDAATKEGLGNVKLLNNETQIAKALEDAISRKDSADAAREILSVFDKGTIGGGILGGAVGGPFDNDSFGGKLGNIIVGAVAGKYLFSTKAKTNIASALNSMSGGAKKELSRLIGGEITSKALSSSTKKSLSKALEKAGMSNIPTPSEFTTEEISSIFKNLGASDIINPISASITTSVMDEEE